MSHHKRASAADERERNHRQSAGPKVGRIGWRVPMALGQRLYAVGYSGLLKIDQPSAYFAIFILFTIIGAGGGWWYRP